MIEDMTVHNLVEKTKSDYVRHVKSLAAFLGRSPDTATPEDLRRFQLNQTKSGVVHRPSTARLLLCASSSGIALHGLRCGCSLDRTQ